MNAFCSILDKVSGSTQHNNCFVDPRQPVVSDTVSSSNSNNLEPSSASNQNGSASEGSSQAISEEDHLKWDANPLRNKANLSIPGTGRAKEDYFRCYFFLIPAVLSLVQVQFPALRTQLLAPVNFCRRLSRPTAGRGKVYCPIKGHRARKVRLATS